MSQELKTNDAREKPVVQSGQRCGWRGLALLDVLRVGAIVGLFLWTARMPFGFVHPDEDSWIFLYRYPPLWQLWAFLAASIGGAAVVFLVFSALRRKKGNGEGKEVVRAFRGVVSPVYFLPFGLMQLIPGALSVLPVLPLLNQVILPVAVSSSVIFLFVIEAGLVPAAFLDKLDRSVHRHRWRWTLLLFLISLMVYGVFTGRLNSVLGYSRGDEGHYLIQARSLAEDFDRDLVNQLPDYTHTREYYEDKHLSEKSPSGKAYSKHYIGLPLLLAPGWMVGEIEGALGVMVAISSLFAVSVFWIAFRFRQRLGFALGWWAVFCFTTPIIFYACRAYPEVAGGLLILVAVWRFERLEFLSHRAWLAFGCLIGLLPWLQTHRLSIPAFLLSVWGAVWIYFRGKRNHLALFLLPLFVSALLLIVLNQHWYGYSWDEPEGKSGLEKLEPAVWTGPYGGGRYLFRCWPGLIGGILHRFRGLVVCAPFYLVAMVCVIAGLFSRDLRFWRKLWLWVFLAIYVPPFSSAAWTGGSCFPGRYMVSGLPLLVFPTAAVFARGRDRFLRAMFGVLAGFSIWLTAQMFFDPFVFFYGVGLAHSYSPALKLLAFLFPYVATGRSVGHIEDPLGLLLFILWLGGLLSVIHLLGRKRLSWRGAFNLVIAVLLALPIVTSTIRRVTGIGPFRSVPANVWGHYFALNDINHSSRHKLHAARWGDVRGGTLKRLLTIELLAVDQKSRTGDVWEEKASGRKVVGYDPLKHEPDFLSYTHPVKLHAGDYVVSLWLRPEEKRGFAILDVQDLGTGRILASRRMGFSDLAPREEFSRAPLHFSLSEFSKVGFRVYVDSKGKVEVLKYSLLPGCLEELVRAAEK